MISIVIPTFNEEKYIGKLLESLVKQDFAEGMEVVIADANSADKTREVAEKYGSSFSRFSIIEGGWQAIGRNRGARASVGDPIFFIDADIILPTPDFLHTAVDYFRKNDLAIATSYLKPLNHKKIDHLLVGASNSIYFLAQFVRPLGAMNIVASREAFEKSGGYPENTVMSEDHDFVLNCSKNGRYGILPGHVYFSVRRFEKEGRLNLTYKYLKASLYRVIFGPITKPIFKYEYGYQDEKKK